jgi:hypothetical protein
MVAFVSVELRGATTPDAFDSSTKSVNLLSMRALEAGRQAGGWMGRECGG